MSYASEVLADSPLAYYRMEEASGTTLADQVASNTGTIVSTVTYGATGAVDSGIVTTGGQLTVPTAGLGLGTAGSIEVWWKYTSGDGQPWRDDSSSSGSMIYLAGTNPLVRINGGDRTITAVTSASLKDGDWHHFVLTTTGTTAKLFIDGAEVDSWARTANFSTLRSPIHMGRNGSSATAMPGGFDELAIYGAVLTPERVAAHFGASVVWPMTLPGLPDHRSPLVTMENLESVAAGVQRIALVTALGDDTEPGTEVVGGGYSRAAVVDKGAITGSGYVYMRGHFESLPAADVVGWEGWSEDGSTRYTYGLISPTMCVARTATNTLCLSGFHGNDVDGYREFPDGAKVVFHPNHCPAGLTAGTVYFVRDSSLERFRVALTAGGTAVTLTDDTDEADPCIVGLVNTFLNADPAVAYVAIRGTELEGWAVFAGYFNS